MPTQKPSKMLKYKHMVEEQVLNFRIFNRFIYNLFLSVTIISVIIMSLLFWSEFLNYMTPDVTEELFVDTSRSPNIQINLDFIVPHISCDCKY